MPVSLGIVLDTSGSMAGEKIAAARSALDRFLFDLLDRDDEIFLYRFSDRPMLLQTGRHDRQLLSRALGRIDARRRHGDVRRGAEALPLAQPGQNRKKALLVISDGNDTLEPHRRSASCKQQIRESEVLVYAIGIDGEPTSDLAGVSHRGLADAASAVPVSVPADSRPGRRVAAD